MSTPPPALVDAYLSEIAKGYGVPWSPPKPDDVNDDNAEGGVKVRLPHQPLRRRLSTSYTRLIGVPLLSSPSCDHE